jgi:hypothetical protein
MIELWQEEVLKDFHQHHHFVHTVSLFLCAAVKFQCDLGGVLQSKLLKEIASYTKQMKSSTVLECLFLCKNMCRFSINELSNQNVCQKSCRVAEVSLLNVVVCTQNMKAVKTFQLILVGSCVGCVEIATCGYLL